MRTWNQRLKEAREALKISQADFARRVGVRQPTVYEWEEGTTKSLKGPNLLKVATALETTPEWLLTGKGARARNVPAAISEPPPDYFAPGVLDMARRLMELNGDQREAIFRTLDAYDQVRAAAKEKQQERGGSNARSLRPRRRPTRSAAEPE